ncbi:MAG TPA: T9SS type A sorting domain-containing protein [Bacteroidia bacterium]|nr:T9SS type A sorting domain-containing protein [Bacteroidia bacterium]
MKKSLLLLSLFTVMVLGVKAQCTIAPTCSVTTGYCSTPAVGSALPNATEMTAYSTTIQVSVGTSYSVATITDATVTSVSGLPTGLAATYNPSNGVIAGGSSGCILISGTPAMSTAGSYTVTANVSVNTNFGVFPTTLTWNLTVDAMAGIGYFTAPSANLFLAPNPAKTELTVAADFHFQAVRVYDALGNLVLTQNANGASKATVMVDGLNAGFYFLQVTDGNKVATRKFIKD